MKAPLALAVVLLAGSASADMFKPSKEQQVSLGIRAADELRHKEKVLPSTDPRVRLVRRVGSRLLSTLDDRGEPWVYSFDVIESKQINAFALPGGPTFVFTGLLDRLKTEDELAGILGHELTHVRRQHWAYAYADSQKRQLGLALLLTLGNASSTVGNLASISNQLIFDLPFSRKHESEADSSGLEMMTQAGYNPQGMVDVFTMLSQQPGGKPPEFLSDHPTDKGRIARIQAKIAQMNGKYAEQKPMRFVDGYSG